MTRTHTRNHDTKSVIFSLITGCSVWSWNGSWCLSFTLPYSKVKLLLLVYRIYYAHVQP